MTETRILVDELAVKFEGLFNLSELYRLIDTYTKDKGYDKEEKKNEEVVSAKGKTIHVVLMPNKKISDYVELFMKIDIRGTNIQRKETVIDKKRVSLHEGKLEILFSAIIKTDYEGKWDIKPIYWMYKTFADKFFYRKQIHDHGSEVTEHVLHLKEQVGAYLNLQRYKK